MQRVLVDVFEGILHVPFFEFVDDTTVQLAQLVSLSIFANLLRLRTGIVTPEDAVHSACVENM